VLLKKVLNDEALLEVGVKVIFDHLSPPKLLPWLRGVVPHEHDDEWIRNTDDVHVLEITPIYEELNFAEGFPNSSSQTKGKTLLVNM
jgi:hypothetical protein